MKKAFVLALAVILTLSLAVPAAAVGSPTAPETSETTTAPLPEIVGTEVETGTKLDDGTVILVEPVAVEDTADLSEEAQKTYASAQETLAEAVPSGMKTQYFFYVTIVKTNTDRTIKENYDGSVNMTVKIANVSRVVVKQFVDGKWVPLEAVINADGTVTIKGVVEGPIAIFTE